MAHILIVEDEPSIADTLLFVLQGEGFSVTWKTLAGDALNLLLSTPVDLVIMDVGLPDITGFEACKQLRKFSNVPVIFLTARGDELDRVVGLEIGADDYVVKPFSPREVAARVKAILKRVAPVIVSSAANSVEANPIPNEFKIDLSAYRFFIINSYYNSLALNLNCCKHWLSNRSAYLAVINCCQQSVLR